ncbi:hypothetical protein MTBBW1_1650019 [Desulfamplus magnetovallimortis]|uniref:Uncharacterized protein n=1 Tax=Desulfamplus magnetovallimortis TaxID=1246637 RepID=A0A1W1H914_9BACT|nr:hypothetical protein MTBBW1_1650019 [Desulfamplus magnetovallimortis]
MNLRTPTSCRVVNVFEPEFNKWVSNNTLRLFLIKNRNMHTSISVATLFCSVRQRTYNNHKHRRGLNF